MNRRVSFCCVALLGVGCLIPLANGQVAPGAAPAAAAGGAAVPELKLNANAVPTPAEQQQMAQWVTALLGVVNTGAPAEQKIARERLFNYMPHAGAQNIAPPFIDAYARALDDGLVAQMKANPSVRTRMQIGVIAAKAATRAEDYSHPLSDVAELLLQDQSEAVALWGMQTAKAVLPGKLGLGGNMYAGLLNRIVPVASKYPGPVLEEAYEALTLSPMKLKSNGHLLGQAPVAARVKIVIPEVHKLLAKRLTDWGNGVPKQPLADTAATGFLTIPGVWPLQTPVQQKQTLAATHELLGRATTAFMGASAGKEKDDLRDVVILGASAMQTMAQYLKDPTLEGAASQLRKITSGAQNDKVQLWMDGVTSAYNANPTVKAAASAGAPTTQSAASPIGQAAASK